MEKNIQGKSKVKDFFGKIGSNFKKKNADEEIIDSISEEEEAAGNSSIKEKAPALSIEMDRLKAQLAAMSEYRKVSNDRFLRVAEEMGEIRSNLLNLEKEMKEIMLRVAKSVEIVEAAKPEELILRINEQNRKFDMYGANIESSRALSEKVLREIKDVQQKMALYRGVEQVIKLNKESEQKAFETQKIKSIIEKRSDKIETMFINVKKSFDRFEKFEAMAREMNLAKDAMQNEFEKIKSKVEGVCTKEEVKKSNEEMKESLEWVVNTVNELKNSLVEMHGVLEKSRLNSIDSMQAKQRLLETATAKLEKGNKIILDNVALLKTRIKWISETAKKGKTIDRLVKRINWIDENTKDLRKDSIKAKKLVLERFSEIKREISASRKSFGRVCYNKELKLSEEEIEKMKKDAEAHAEENKQRKERIGTLNEAETMVYQYEKTLRELGDKVDKKSIENIQKNIKVLKELLKDKEANYGAIKKAKDSLTEKFQKLFEELYRRTAKEQAKK